MNKSQIRLRTDHADQPLGIGVDPPLLQWAFDTAVPLEQAGYRVLVASERDGVAPNDANAWDSRWMDGREQAVEYDGESLSPRTRYWWRVLVRTDDGETIRSDPTWFETGIEDWSANWIGPGDSEVDPSPAPRFRRTVSINGKVERARLYIAVGGTCELSIDGKPIGDRVLDTAVTDYEERVLYATHDVTDGLQEGEHVIEAVVGRGRYAMTTENVWGWHQPPWHADRPNLLAELDVEFADGSGLTIGTDEDWTVADDATRFDSLYEGERYDARTADPEDWTPARPVDGPDGAVVPQEMKPMRVVDELEPVAVDEPDSGVYIFDFGQVTAGWAELRVDGPEGTEVTLRYGERRTEDGTVDLDQPHVEGDFQTDRYVLDGDGVETWAPAFSYKGFQYVEVEGFPEEPDKDALTAKVIHSAVDEGPTGKFECGDDLLNRIHENTCRTLLNNFHGIPTDTPVYEKNGWTGDALVGAHPSCYNFSMARFFRKWLADFADAQHEDGEVPPIVPTSDWGYSHAPFDGGILSPNPAWDAAYHVVPWVIYQHTGDRRLLEEHYEGMVACFEYLGEYAEDNILDEGLGDWLAPGHGEIRALPPEGTKISGTAHYYRAADILAEVAGELGREEDERRFATHREEIADAFNDTFLADEEVYSTGEVDEYRQASNVFPLAFGIVPDNRREAVVENLVENVMETHNGHLDTGFHGTAYLLPVLTEAGHVDVAYTVATQRTYPSWGHWIEEHDATTIYEAWELESRSQDHYAFGAIDEWFYGYLAGIQPAEPGFERVLIDPYPPLDLNRASAIVETVRGPVSAAWERTDDGYDLEVSVPGNTTATVRVPGDGPVRIDGTTPADTDAVQSIDEDGDRIRCTVGAGTHQFTS